MTDRQQLVSIARESHKGLFDAYSEDEIVATVEHLVEGNSKEDLAMLYLEALGRGGWEYCIKEYLAL